MAALAGFLILGEGLRGRDIAAIALVATACAGASITAARQPTQPLEG
jgi:threonine/homoserine efflux transporter RhtA